MSMRRFVEAIGRPAKIVHSCPDRIPGTNKVRTYTANSSVYSKQSDLKNLTSAKCCSPGKFK